MLTEENKKENQTSPDIQATEVSLEPIVERRTSSTIIRRRKKPTKETLPPEKPKDDEPKEKQIEAKDKVDDTEAPKSDKEAKEKQDDELKKDVKVSAKIKPKAKVTKKEDKDTTKENKKESEPSKDEIEQEAKTPKEKIIDPIEMLERKVREETNPTRRTFLESQLIAAKKLRDQRVGISEPVTEEKKKVKTKDAEEKKVDTKTLSTDKKEIDQKDPIIKKDKKLGYTEDQAQATKIKKQKAAKREKEQMDYESILLQEQEDSKIITPEEQEKLLEEAASNVYVPTKTVHIPKKDMGKRTKRQFKQTLITKPKAIKTKITLTQVISVADLAKNMNVKATEIITKMMGSGLMLTVNQIVDIDTATLIASDFGIEVSNETYQEDKVLEKAVAITEDFDKEIRPPVVTIMGHVDHGKTSLLDLIRNSNVTEGEAGGITQHIGAYTVKHNNKIITFIDTPGHEAFTRMRERGAGATDVVILVVAADDGVMPQTIESISHAKASKVPLIVAINKIDKPNINLEKIYQQLSEYEIVSEEWGGENIFCKVSAKENTGIDDLLESILLQVEMLELKARDSGPASGVVLEANMEKGRGCIATVLVKEGLLTTGQMIIAGTEIGRIKSLTDFKGNNVESAGPSIPVAISGLSKPPAAGDTVNVVTDEKIASDIVEQRKLTIRKEEATNTEELTLSELISAKQSTNEQLKFNIIIKADTKGSIEALSHSLLKLNNEKVNINIVHETVGGINESDIILATTTDSVIIGFNVRADKQASDLAPKKGVLIHYNSIIYSLIDEIKSLIEGRAAPTMVEKVIGKAEVRQTFSVPKLGVIAGTAVIDGKVTRNSQAKLIRNNIVIYDGKIVSLRRFKDDVKEVSSGYECGIGIEKYSDIKEGDIIEAYIMEETKTVIF